MKRIDKNQRLQKGMSRRGFMGGAAGALAGFMIVPRHVLGGAGFVAPSGKVHIASIGVSGQAGRDIDSIALEKDEKTRVKDVEMVTLCDVDGSRGKGTYEMFPDAHRYVDFREMLDKEKDNIDGVIVATPDHVHAIASMTAIKLGKHVYCEKPLTHTIGEARALTEAARKAGVATQMGNQGQASEETRRMCETIWAGAIGAVREVHVWTDRPLDGTSNVYWPQGIARPTDKPGVPETLAWDLWLGPAPARDYHPCYLPAKWRGWWDFGTGALGDMGCHRMDPIFRALKLGAPTCVYATSTLVNSETYPVASMVYYEFPARGDMPPVRLTWYDGGMRPAKPALLEDGRQLGTNGILYVGDDGMMLESTIIPESKRKSTPAPPKTIPRSIGHHREWVEACKGGQPGGSNFDFAGPLTEAVLLGNIALRPELRDITLKEKLVWDSANMKITNVPEANAFIQSAYRAGWSV